MRDKGIYNMKRALPRMSWTPKNLFNLYQRTMGDKKKEIVFDATTKTLFQQRWRSKAVVRAYHGDHINEKIFKRWYLPETLPDVRPRRKVVSGDDKASLEEYALRKKLEKEREEEEEKKGMAPVGSLMFAEVERRIDVFLFRCCFAHSVYEARRLIVHGDVLLNGKKHTNANTRLAPGDMVSVHPAAIRFFRRPAGSAEEYDDVLGYDGELAKKIEKLQMQKGPAVADTTVPATPAEKEFMNKALKGEEVEVGAEAEASTSSEPTEAAAEAPKDAEKSGLPAPTPEIIAEAKAQMGFTPFYLPQYASPWLFVPAYIEPSFKTCSAIYVRHPTARPGYSEIPTPYDADGEVVRFAWEWYVKRRTRVRGGAKRSGGPEDRAAQMVEKSDIEEGRRGLRRDIEKMKARQLRL